MSVYLVQESDMTSIADAIREKTGKSDKINFDDMVSEISGISTGAALNFEVAGNPQPDNPTEGTVWVNTDIEITGYYLSATAPENPTQGMLWIKISDSSSIKVETPLDKDHIAIMFNVVSQYDNGVWVDVDAKSFQNGMWIKWYNGELYKHGNEYADITGGWSAFVGYGDASPYNLGLYTESEKSIVMQYNGSRSCIYCGPENKIDLTNVSRIIVNAKDCTTTAALYVTSSRTSYAYQNAIASCGLSPGVYELDVSGIVGNYYVVIGMQSYYSASTYFEFDEVRME